MKVLKAKLPILSVTDFDSLSELRCEYKVVYERQS